MKFTDQEKDMLEELDDVGHLPSNPAYQLACEMTVRTAFYCMILGCIVWVPAFRKPFPNTLTGYMGLAALLYMFTINKVLGTTIGNSIVGIFGTWLACAHMWVMQGIYPGGMEP